MAQEYESVGRLDVRRTIGDLHFARTDFEPPLRAPRHSHGPASFTIVLSGRYQESATGLPREHRAGTLIHKPPEEPHSNRFDGRAKTLIVQFPGRTTWREQLNAPILEETFTLESPDLLDLTRRMLAELETGGACAELSLQCRVFELINLATETHGRRAPIAPSSVTLLARDWLHAHFHERLDLERIASEIDVTPSYLARAFRRAFGCTLGAYQRQLRVARAMALLASGEGSLAELAQRTGFADQSHLNRVFRRHVAMTPGAYRRVAAGRDGIP